MSTIIFMFIPLIFMSIFIWQAIWVAMDSRKRGEEYWWLWTIAAFIAFPVGIIVYAIVSRSDRRRCNNCGKEVPKDLKLCPYCGQRCGNFCPNCGQNVQPGWKFCPSCTTELPEELANSKKVTNNKPIIIVVSIIIALALLFVGMLFVSYASFFSISGSYVEEFNSFDTSGYKGEVFDRKTTEVLTYTIPSNSHSFWYKGEREKGDLVVKIYNKDGSLKGESEKISSEEFTEGMIAEPGEKIEVYLNDYKGSFYVRFN